MTATARALVAAVICAACATPALASGLHCTTTFLDQGCDPLPDDALIDGETLFRVGCEASGPGGEAPTVTDFEPTADELVIVTDDPLVDVPVGLVPVEQCGAAVFALDGCLAPGTYTIAHADDGSGWPAFDAAATPCAAGGDGGCQQALGSGAPGTLGGSALGCLLLGCLLLGRARRGSTANS